MCHARDAVPVRTPDALLEAAVFLHELAHDPAWHATAIERKAMRATVQLLLRVYAGKRPLTAITLPAREPRTGGPQ